VKDGKIDAALTHFRNPTEQIEAWYKDAVDEYRSESSRKTFTRTFKHEFSAVLRAIENATNSDEVLSIIMKYSAGLEFLYYQPSSNFPCAASTEELRVMKDEIMKTMKENQHKFCTVDDESFSRPSDDAGVMSRLGCTARCRWCSALCWGQRGHEANQDETRKHHSSHQPQGLAGSFYETGHLISQPCRETRDETPIRFGEYRESGILWQVAKQEHFSDWKFDNHCISKFNELMRWFFQQLHHSIAEKSLSQKPATAEDLEKYNCNNLNYDDIMSRVEQEIN